MTAAATATTATVEAATITLRTVPCSFSDETPPLWLSPPGGARSLRADASRNRLAAGAFRSRTRATPRATPPSPLVSAIANTRSRSAPAGDSRLPGGEPAPHGRSDVHAGQARDQACRHDRAKPASGLYKLLKSFPQGTRQRPESIAPGLVKGMRAPYQAQRHEVAAADVHDFCPRPVIAFGRRSAPAIESCPLLLRFKRVASVRARGRAVARAG
jgi:hypothetical protein